MVCAEEATFKSDRSRGGGESSAPLPPVACSHVSVLSHRLQPYQQSTLSQIFTTPSLAVRCAGVSLCMRARLPILQRWPASPYLELDTFAVSKAECHVIVQDGVHVLDPKGVDGPVKYRPPTDRPHASADVETPRD